MPPPELPEAPVLYSWLTGVYQAFWRLSKQRTIGMSGPDKIKASDIFYYFRELMPCDDSEQFYDLITAMDAEFIRFISEKEEGKEKDKTAGEGAK